MKYLISVIIAISLLMVSCSEDSPTEGKSTEIKVGVLLSLTGDGASLGETARAAIEYAKHEIDDFVYLAGSEYSFNVIIEDTETDTAVALQKLRGFAAQGINIVIGPQTSAEAAHIKAYADSNDILLVSPTSVAISLAIPNDNLFRLPTADNIQAEAMAALMRQDGIDRVVAVVRDDVWGRDLMNSFQDKFRGMGGDIHYAYFYDPADPDFNEAITMAETYAEDAADIDGTTENVALYMASFAEGAEILELGADKEWLGQVRWYGASAFAENKALIENYTALQFAHDRGGVPCPIFALEESAINQWQPVVDAVENATGRKADAYSVCAYDAMWLVANTWLALNLPAEFSDIRSQFIQEASEYNGATGATDLNEAGDRAEGNYDFWSIKQNGELHWAKSAHYDSRNGKITRYL